jgi:hypothetical protein
MAATKRMLSRMTQMTIFLAVFGFAFFLSALTLVIFSLCHLHNDDRLRKRPGRWCGGKVYIDIIAVIR